MTMKLQNQEWLNLNAARNYPLADTATCLDLTGSFRIPDDFLVGLYLSIPALPGLISDQLLIQQIVADTAGYTITVGYGEYPSITPVASFVVLRESHVKDMTYALAGFGDFLDTIGRAVVHHLGAIDKQPVGVWRFNLAGARLDPDASRPTLRGVTSVIIANGNDFSEPIHGDIEVASGLNVTFAHGMVTFNDETLPQVTINMIQGTGTVVDCVCPGEPTVTLNPVTSINGVLPDGNGNIELRSLGACLEFSTGDHEVVVHNDCAEPCCGCPDLTRIAEDAQRIQEQAVTLRGFIQRLEQALSQATSVAISAVS